VRWGGKEILVSVEGHGRVAGASLDGRPVAADADAGVGLAFDDLPARSRLEVRCA
jgi:hypothetical protein